MYSRRDGVAGILEVTKEFYLSQEKKNRIMKISWSASEKEYPRQNPKYHVFKQQLDDGRLEKYYFK